mgnify:CR=1 FL=1
MVTVHTLIDEKERFLNELRHNKNRFRDFLSWSSKIVTLVSHKLTMRISPETA